MVKLAVTWGADSPQLQPRAAALAEQLGLNLASAPSTGDAEVLLVVAPGGLDLVALRGPGATPASKPFHVDLARLDATSGPGRSRKQPLARAVGLGKAKQPQPTVLDATAGWGEDAWLLALLGCQVLAVERHPVVAAMLQDGLRRLAHSRPDAAGRLMVACGDARSLDPLPWRYARFLGPDVVYLDPMFDYGERRRRGQERRPLVLLRQLVGDDADAPDLLDWALACAGRRVVVKRPLHGPYLGGRKPVASHKGKALRWDVYPAVS